MSAKHTPGPWALSGSTVYAFEQDGWYRGEPRMVNRFTAHVQTTKLTAHDECMANARLIRAAPELLEALKFALGILHEADARLGYHPDSLGAIEMEEAITGARAAIARATGEQG